MPKAPKASSSSSRHANSRASNVVVDPTDPSEAIALGIEAEERGERAAYGNKALRNYQEAARLYALAVRLDPQGEEAADAAYNAGRVLYLIGSGFVMLDRKAQVLEESVASYKRAAHLEQRGGAQGASSSSSPSPFMLDIVSNLAASLQAQADALTGEAGEDHTSEARAAAVASEAYQLYESMVAREQETVLKSQLQDETSALQGSQNGIEAETESASMDADQDERLGAIEQEDIGSPSAQYASSLIVPSSLLETYHSLHNILLDILLPLAKSSEDLEQVRERMAGIVARAEDFVQQCDAACGWGERASPNDEWLQGINQLSRDALEGEVAVATSSVDLALRAADGQALAGLGLQITELAQARLASLQALLTPAAKEALMTTASSIPESRRREFYQMRVDEVTSSAEQAMTLARTLLRLAAVPDASGASTTSAASTRLSWSLANSASQAYLLALSLLDTTGPGGAAAVLGARASANPTTLLRCQVFTALASLCLLRGDPQYVSTSNASQSPAVVVSSTSRATIRDNARIYARRALGEVGLTWVYEPAPPRQTPVAAKAQLDAVLGEIPPGGWDAVDTMGEAILTLARAVWRRGQGGGGAPGEADAELAVLAVNAGRFAKGSAAGWGVALDARRFAQSIVEEEGSMLPEEERFWEEWEGKARVG
ncbi:hypothetical protein BCV69DRAFT_310747 [Microstroma glucosiphilum]|uniref:Uncharacterized protein n=1 Tax=Pseudomicrostroma glucosiphilum TaxID=1684307 RepID=A0A316UDJ4_9BASI|nr:hypothetical protein BCV69DRAFT_310747 [Pseudomicrostroma glucosiphilum]PWN23276.1 hypothetical protein BCV69DRAFT_310747 [Pseudomicrostroma glucosiphilum]